MSDTGIHGACNICNRDLGGSLSAYWGVHIKFEDGIIKLYMPLHSWYCIRHVRHRWQHQVIHGSAQLPNSIPEVLGSCDGAQPRLQHCSCESPKGACSVVAHLARGPGVLIDLLLLRTAMMLGLSSLLGGGQGSLAAAPSLLGWVHVGCL